ncbi:MAG TPA: hypothetical protein VMJ73_13540 [Rhizomicrobium sp.]|nr:hypothetical protein [Rhizomicrobium sp.]
MSGPDEAMLAPVMRLAQFMATLDESCLEGLFDDDLTIIENFAPYVFRGPYAAAAWQAGFREHAEGLSGLVPAFGEPQDFSRTGERVYFVLPTRWTGESRKRPFTEQGGWSFVLSPHGRRWRIAAYAWSVIEIRPL